MWNRHPIISGLLLTLFITLIGGYATYQLQKHEQRTDSTTTAVVGGGGEIGSQRPDFTLPDLDGKPQNISNWDHQIVLVNFWATWCPPCRREIPGFMALREQYNAQGFEIIGVAIDSAEATREFSNALEINYPILHGEGNAMQVTSAYGNRQGALPYSVLIDRNGKITNRWAGELEKAELEYALKPLL